MSQVFGYICSDDSLTAAVMRQIGAPLRAVPPEDRVGLGIGWLQEGRSLLRKHPKRKAASVDVPSLLADVPSRSLVGHVRHRELGRVGTKQLQPFRYRNWVYAQKGMDGAFEDIQAALTEGIPDHVRRNIGGTSLPETVFHIFCTKMEQRLSNTGTGKHGQMYAQTLGETMGELEKLAKEGDEPELGSLLAVAATDRCMVACRVGEPLFYRVVEGIEEASEEPLFAGHKPRTITHDRFRAVLVASAVDDDQWEELPDRHVMWVDDDWEVYTEEI